MLVGFLVALLADNIIGMLWYSPTLFGDSWIKLTHPGKRITELKANPGVYIAANIGHVIVATTIYFITQYVYDVYNAVTIHKESVNEKWKVIVSEHEIVCVSVCVLKANLKYI